MIDTASPVCVEYEAPKPGIPNGPIDPKVNMAIFMATAAMYFSNAHIGGAQIPGFGEVPPRPEPHPDEIIDVEEDGESSSGRLPLLLLLGSFIKWSPEQRKQRPPVVLDAHGVRRHRSDGKNYRLRRKGYK